MNTMNNETDRSSMRVVWAGLLLILGWFLMAVIQVVFTFQFRCALYTFYCMAYAVVGAAVYLVTKNDIKWKIISFGFAIASALMSAISLYTYFLSQRFSTEFRLTIIFRDPQLYRTLASSLIAAVLCLVAVLVLSKINKKTGMDQAMICGLIGGVVYIVIRFASSLRSFIYILTYHHMIGEIISPVLPILLAGIVIFVFNLAFYHLCSQSRTEVKLYGIGLVWAWLALVVSVVSLIAIIAATTIDQRLTYMTWLYSSSLILGLCGLIGYLLLIIHKRNGLYFILLGSGLMIVGMIFQILQFAFYHIPNWFPMLASQVLGALNPLFAYLAVNAADKRAGSGTQFAGQPAAPGMPNAAHPIAPGAPAAAYPAAPGAPASAYRAAPGAPASAYSTTPGAPGKPTVVQATPAGAPAGQAFGNTGQNHPLGDLKKSLQGSLDKLYSERDNMGTRQENMSQAMSYWMIERRGLSVKPPFTLYTLPSAAAAEEALLEMPFIHRASDSGKLICDRIMTYGYYETTLNGQLTGQYEALLAGNDLTLEEFNKAEDAFKRHGGTLKNHDAPAASVQAQTSAGNASLVKYKETVKGNDGISTYEVYTGPDKASATAFLKTKPVTRRLYYIVVDTPEGSFGRDINGFYQE